MSNIRCSTCGHCNPAHFKGTKAEENYMCVIDATGHEQNQKLFFCSDACYLDREFIIFILHKAGEEWRPMTTHMCMREYPDLVNTYRGNYDEIVQDANKSYGLEQYRLRNGIINPFQSKVESGSPPPIPENINWADEAENDVLVC
jgi:hypothetical protein